MPSVLRHLPKEQRKRVYKRFNARSIRSASFWTSLPIALLICILFDMVSRTNLEPLAAWTLLAAIVLFLFWYIARISRICHRIFIEELRALVLCTICGYDLRATPHRCPECGTPTELSHAAASRPAPFNPDNSGSSAPR
jgi:predicted RNA-binding Zn-ribbon protein involved in translation (DUF1610 family)